MDRMQHLSRTLRRFASFLFAISVLGLLFSPGLLFTGDLILKTANDTLRHLDVEGIRFNAAQLVWRLRIVVFLPMAVWATTALLSLGALIRLLHQFEAGATFSMESVHLVRFLGWVQVAMAPAELLLLWSFVGTAKALLGLTIHPWAQLVNAGVGNLFFGGVLLLIAFVLEEGLRLKSEQELVI